jgi:hypothetical protein
MAVTRGGGAETRRGGAAPTGRLTFPSVAIKEKQRRFIRVSMMRRARHSPPHFSLCPACLERPMWTGDGLGRRTPYWAAPDGKDL